MNKQENIAAAAFFNQTLGASIRTARLKMGLSQRQIAEWIGVTFQQIQKYESGESSMSVYRIWQIANVLEISLDALFHIKNQYENYDKETVDSFMKLYDFDERTKGALLEIISRLDIDKR